VGGLISEFLSQVELLREKLAILLVQLPPKLALETSAATRFFKELGTRTTAAIVVEPRHPTWFEPVGEDLLSSLRIARVAADPAICLAAASPGGWRGLEYWRLHGSPIKYRSSYQGRLDVYAEALVRADARTSERWCIFDNTASSAAIEDAVQLQARIGEHDQST